MSDETEHEKSPSANYEVENIILQFEQNEMDISNWDDQERANILLNVICCYPSISSSAFCRRIPNCCFKTNIWNKKSYEKAKTESETYKTYKWRISGIFQEKARSALPILCIGICQDEEFSKTRSIGNCSVDKPEEDG